MLQSPLNIIPLFIVIIRLIKTQYHGNVAKAKSLPLIYSKLVMISENMMCLCFDVFLIGE